MAYQSAGPLPKDPAAYRAACDQLESCTTLAGLRAIVPVLRALEPALHGEVARVWIHRWFQLSEDDPPVELWT